MMVANTAYRKGKFADILLKHIAAFTLVLSAILPIPTNSKVFPNPTIQRSLVSGFDDFNKIFENASVEIREEFEVSERVAFTDLDMTIRNIKCYDITLGNIVVDHERESDTTYLVNVAIVNLDLTCEMSYDYSYGILSGDGWVQIQTENSDVTSAISFASTDFDRGYPPTDSMIRNCFSDVEIRNMDFEEDFASEVLEVFQGLIRSTVEIAIGGVACEELSVIGTNVVGNMVEMAANQLEPYLDHLGDSATDPLYLEQNLVIPGGFKPLNLQYTEGQVGKAFDEILQYFDTYLGVAVSDSSKATNDLVINNLLRSLFLSDDGSLPIDPTSMSTLMDPILFEGHDQLVEFTITLNEVRLYGLDTITRFNSFRKIGKHTIQNELTWDTLTFEFDITLNMKPSSLDDAILIDPTSPGITENFTIDFSVNNIDVEASLLLVLDEDAMGLMELGPLFYTENILPCVLSIVHEVELSGLDVDPSYINDGPTIKGFLASGLDQVISDSLEAAFSMYKGSLRTAIPNIFQTEVRGLINTFFLDAYISDKENSKCPELQTWEEGVIDFRKFFNSNNEAYGDLIPMLKEKLDDNLLSTNNETGSPRINDALIAPFTGAQSGTKGKMLFPFDLMSLLLPNTTSQQFGMESIEFRLFNPMIENMDTFEAPIKLMEPNTTSGQILDNYATLGTNERKLKIGVRGLVAADGDPALAMNNEVDIFVEFAGSDALLSLMANVDATKLFTFPLQDVTNLHCWLDILQTSDSTNEAQKTGFSIMNTLLATTSMNFNVSCAKCTSPSLSILPGVLESFEAFGISDVLEIRLVDLLLDLVQSDYSQSYIDGILMDASLRCPHSPKFIDLSASSSQNSTLEFPTLDYKSLETIAFASTVVTEIAAVVMAKAHESYNLEATYPLSAQDGLSVEDDVQLIDFTALDESVGKWASSGVQNFRAFLNDVVSDPNGQNGISELRVNNIIRSSLLDENGHFSIMFDSVDIENAGIGISFKEIKVLGLDTISKLNIIDAIGPQTIQNEVHWENIRFQLMFSLVDPSNSSPTEERNITISVGASDVDLSMAVFMAMDLDRLQSLEMWSVMELRKILPCIMSAAHASSFTELEFSIGSFTEISIDGFFSSDLISAARDSSRLILENYGESIISSVPKFFDSTVRNLLNNWLQYYKDGVPSNTCKYSPSDNSGFVDLRDLLRTPRVASLLGGSGRTPYGDMFRTALQFVQNILKVDELTALSGFNDIVVAPLTESKSNEIGTLYYPGDLLSGEEKVQIGALDTNVQFRAYSAKIENLNTIGAPIEFFGGVAGEPYSMNNTLTAGVGEQPLRFSTKILLALKGDDNIEISNEIDLSLGLTNANVIFSTMTKVLESKLLGFPLRDVFDLNCWLATIPAPTLDSYGVRLDDSELTASLSGLGASVGEVIVTASCANCSSPRMVEFADLLSSPATRNETTDVTNALLTYVTQLMGGNFLQVQIDRALNDAARKCPHSVLYDPDATPVVYETFESPDTTYSMGYLVLLGALALTTMIVLLTVTFAVKWIVRRRHRNWLFKLPPHQLKKLASEQRSDMDIEAKLNNTTSSMFRSADIPCIVRLIIPAVIIGNVFFFLSGHLSLGATVNIEAEVAGEKFTIEKFFEFSMARSTIDIWKAGGRELAVLILIFSGVWPYTKLLMTLWLWFVSPSNLSVSRRGSILVWLDWLAKWSMIDIFVLVISIAAFRISIESPDASFFPEGFYVIEMMVIPLWGLYANMIAQLLSQVTSHVIIYYHRQIVTKAIDGPKKKHRTTSELPATVAEGRFTQDSEALENKMRPYSADNEEIGSQSGASFEDITIGQSTSSSTPESFTEERMSLNTYHFSRPHRGETEKLLVRRYVNKILPFCGFSLMVCIIIGCILPSFSLELFGIVGVAVEFGQDFEEATINHSVFSVIRLLFDQASFLGTARDYLGLIVLSVLFVSTILFVPVIQSITLLRQWFSVTTVTQKKKIAVRLEILQAWQYLEVYLVALFVSSWQLGPVSEFMINAYCKNLEDAFAQMVYFGVLKEEDAQCFSVVSSIEQNAFLLVAGSILLTFLSSFVCKAAAQYLRDGRRLERRINGEDHSNVSFSDGTVQSDDGNEVSESSVDLNIHQVPVLFTDTFRWLLKGSTSIASGDRTLFADPDNSHWSLPQATVVTDHDLHSDDRVINGTYLSNLGPEKKSEKPGTKCCIPGANHSRSSLKGSVISNASRDSYISTGRGGKFDSAETMGGKKPYGRHLPRRGRLKRDQSDSSSSLGQHSISSKMASWDSSSISEPVDASSLAYSVSTNTPFAHSSPSDVCSSPKSPRSLRKPPPPSQYCLSADSLNLKKAPPHFNTADPNATERSQQNLKKPPPPSSLPSHSPRLTSKEEDYGHTSVCSGPTTFVDDDDDEYSTIRTIEDIIKEVENGGEENIDSIGFGQQSTSHRHFT